MYDEVVFSRQTPVVLIPDGVSMVLDEGTVGYVTQNLGGNYTIQLPTRQLVRVANRDIDAIGLEPTPLPEPKKDSEGNICVDLESIYGQMRTCFDPEIPVNIVDLGLIYNAQLQELDAGTYSVEVIMTLTAPGCGMGDILCADVKECISQIPGVTQCEVEVVLDPPWSPDRMSEEARLELGFF